MKCVFIHFGGEKEVLSPKFKIIIILVSFFPSSIYCPHGWCSGCPQCYCGVAKLAFQVSSRPLCASPTGTPQACPVYETSGITLAQHSQPG